MTKLIKTEDIAYLMSKIMPITWLTFLARQQGRAVHRWGHSGKIVRDNFAKFLPSDYTDEELDRMSREFFEWERVRAIVAVLAPTLSNNELEEYVTIEGEENLRQALDRGKGAILLGSHLNSIGMFTAIILLRRRGFDIGVALADDEDVWAKSKTRRILDRIFGRTDTLTEAIGGFYCQFNIRPIVSRLRNNQLVAQTGDGWHSAKFVSVNFLGKKLPFTTGSWSVAQTSGASVVPMFLPGSPLKTLRVIFQKPIELSNGPDSIADMEKNIAMYAHDLENYLLEGPPSWMHWLREDALNALVEWTQQELEKRYEFD